MSLGKILDTVSSSAAAVLSYSAQVPPPGGDIVAVERRGFLDIDLNVAPPEDDGPFSPTAEQGRDDVVPPPVGEFGTERKERKIGRWDALLEVAEYEGNLRSKETHELGGELQSAMTRRKFAGRRRSPGFEESWKDDGDVAVVVVRSSRGRPVAMPNKYRDSVVGAAAWAELARRGKSAAVVSTKRKFS